jgi:hypothetical protein
MTNADQELLIDHVIEEFDFDMVHKAMRLLDWHWMTTRGNGFEVPSKEQLIASARQRLRSSVKSGYCASGGLVARYHPATKKDGEWFSLEFVLCSADNYD